jgi:inhibitor of cysteine peptidase
MNANILFAGAAFCLAALFATGSQAMGATPDPLTVTQADAGKTVALAVGQRLNVHLSEQAGTGYSWITASDSTPLLKFEGASSGSGATMPGGAEIQVLVYSAAAAGKGTLKIEYRRSWEKDQPPEKSFSIAVTIKQ